MALSLSEAGAQEITAASVDAITVGGVRFEYSPGAIWPDRVLLDGWITIPVGVDLPRLVPVETGDVQAKALAYEPSAAPLFRVSTGPNRSWIGRINGGGGPGDPSPTAYMTWAEKVAYYKRQHDVCTGDCTKGSLVWVASCQILMLATKVPWRAGPVVCTTTAFVALEVCKSACPSEFPPNAPPPEPPPPTTSSVTNLWCVVTVVPSPYGCGGTLMAAADAAFDYFNTHGCIDCRFNPDVVPNPQPVNEENSWLIYYTAGRPGTATTPPVYSWGNNSMNAINFYTCTRNGYTYEIGTSRAQAELFCEGA